MLNERQVFSHFEMSIGSTEIRESEDLFVSATHVEAPKGIDPTISSNVWKIDIETAYNTLKVTSQHRKIDVDNSLSRGIFPQTIA